MSTQSSSPRMALAWLLHGSCSAPRHDRSNAQETHSDALDTPRHAFRHDSKITGALDAPRQDDPRYCAPRCASQWLLYLEQENQWLRSEDIGAVAISPEAARRRPAVQPPSGGRDTGRDDRCDQCAGSLGFQTVDTMSAGRRRAAKSHNHTPQELSTPSRTHMQGVSPMSPMTGQHRTNEVIIPRMPTVTTDHRASSATRRRRKGRGPTWTPPRRCCPLEATAPSTPVSRLRSTSPSTRSGRSGRTAELRTIVGGEVLS